MTPEKWAIRISHILNTVLGNDHFPIKITEVAQEISTQLYPDDPITKVMGDSIPNFDGALRRAPQGKRGWGIIYNNNMSSMGRINFTLAHEFGHYLLHRTDYPNGITCSADDVVRWESEYRQIEHQANTFAAYLLMPLDDFRKQIVPRQKLDTEMISHCANRYGVSLIATTLRWLDYTESRSLIVVSRDGFMLWARSSKPAFRTGVFFRTAKQTTPVPAISLANIHNGGGKVAIEHPEGVWFSEPCHETTIFSEQYDFVISLLQLSNYSNQYKYSGDDESESRN